MVSNSENAALGSHTSSPTQSSSFAIQFPESLDELLQPRPKQRPTAILGKDNLTPNEFRDVKITDAVGKAATSARRHYTSGRAKEVTNAVVDDLASQTTFSHGRGPVPHVKDVHEAVPRVYNRMNAAAMAEVILNVTREAARQGMDVSSAAYERVLKVNIEKHLGSEEFDPTGYFYDAYRQAREEIREKIVDMPVDLDFDATDKQLGVHNVRNGNGHAYKFDPDKLLRFILEKTHVAYAEAQSAVKDFEFFLANRKSQSPVSKDELTFVIDASLTRSGRRIDEGLGGRRLAITMDDVDQLLVDKSAENSNIKNNNPEAVNLGIAELVLKEKALRDVFDPEVAEAHRTGAIHLHDLGYVDRVYCSAHSVEYIKKYGLDKVVANLDAKSTPAKSSHVLNNHLHTFLAAIQSSYAGALGFPMLNTLYGPALLTEMEVVNGVETLRGESGEEVAKVRKRLRRTTIESRLDDEDLKEGDFQEQGSAKVLSDYSRRNMKYFAKELVSKLKQSTQNLVFGASQSAFSRGGQTLFIDFNIDLTTPVHAREIPAMFLGGEYVRARKNDRGEWEVIERTKQEPPRYNGEMEFKGHTDASGKRIMEPANKNGDVIQPADGTVWLTYGHEIVRKASQKFAEALFDVAMEGDKYGNMFNFPKIDVHVSKETFEDPEAEALLRKACAAVEKNDSVYFMFDRGDGMNVSQCCRLRERITDPVVLKHPEDMRFCGFQNVSINLPQATFRARGSNLEEKIQSAFGEIDKTMLIALKAHTNKRKFMQYLFNTAGSSMYTMGGIPSDDGKPYIDLAKSTYIFGIVGLNEAVQHITGQQLHESALAYKTGLRILSHMYSLKSEFSKRYGMKCVIEETPGESANRRMAKIDAELHPEQAPAVLKGSKERDEIYYTNSSHLSADAPVGGLDRTILQSMMNPMIEAGAITHIFSGEKINKAQAVYDFVKATYFNTQSSQIVFSGEHTICLVCGKHMRGLHDSCSCGNKDSKRLSQKTRVVGYESDPRVWNKSKQGELRARQEAQEYYAGNRTSLKNLEAELLQSSIEPGKTRIAVIGTQSCSICKLAMDRVENALQMLGYEKGVPRDNIEVVKYDVQTEDGRIMAAIYGTPLDTYPTIIVHQGDKISKKGWEYPYNQKPIGLNSLQVKELISPYLSTTSPPTPIQAPAAEAIAA